MTQPLDLGAGSCRNDRSVTTNIVVTSCSGIVVSFYAVIDSYIYILSNPSFREDLYKIGMTTRTAEDRAWEIYTGATGVPSPFNVEFIFPVSNCAVAEGEIHSALESSRVSDQREFFDVSISKATKVIKTICVAVNDRYPATTPPPEISKDDWVVISPETEEASPASRQGDTSSPTNSERPLVLLSKNKGPQPSITKVENNRPTKHTPNPTPMDASQKTKPNEHSLEGSQGLGVQNDLPISTVPKPYVRQRSIGNYAFLLFISILPILCVFGVFFNLANGSPFKAFGSLVLAAFFSFFASKVYR